MENKQILFIPSSGNHIKFFHPILKSIQKNHDFLILTQGSYKNEGAEKELRRLKIHFKSVDDYSALDPNLILEKENIGLIIVGNDSDIIPQWFINIAKKKNIPSILIQDGLFLDITPLNNTLFHNVGSLINNPSKKLLKLSLKLQLSKQIKKISYGQAGCTQIHVWSDWAKTFLLKKNIPPESIFVTGNLSYEKFSTIENSENQTEELNILYAPTDLIHTKILDKKKVIKIVDDICKSVSLIENAKLIIKPHPIEEINFYLPFIKNYSPKIEISNKESNTLIKKSKFLITNLSAVALDALQQQKPVLIYLPELEKIVNPNSFPFDLIEKDILIYVNNSEELLEKIQYLLKNRHNFDHSQLEIIDKYIGSRDNLILKIIQSINELMTK